MIRRLAFLLLFACSSANAQFVAGQILTAAQLNSAFENVLPMSGGALTGPLVVPSLTVTGLTANAFVFTNSSQALSTTAAPTNGQILIGSTGTAPVASTLTGTANQIAVTNGAGSITIGLPSTLAIPGTITSYKGVSTIGNGAAVEYAGADATAQAANIGTTTLYAVPAGEAGLYRASCYVVLTQAATTSSTMPSCSIGWTDANANVAEINSVTSTGTNNTAGQYGTGSVIVNAAAGTNITYSTNGYATSGATAMQYAIHIKLEAL